MTAISDDVQILIRLSLALAIGLIVGIERGWHTRDVAKGTRAAGVRTFTLIGLLGGLIGAAGQATTEFLIPVALIGLIGFLAVVYATGIAVAEERGITTEIAAIVTFTLGVIAVRGDMIVAAATAVIVVTILDLKSRLHAWIAAVESNELRAGIKLLLISVVVLPLLPNANLGPGGVLNPYQIWWVVVIVAGLSFAAYASIRLMGPKAGAVATGLLGGLASSTAVTLSCAHMALKSPRLLQPLSGAISLAAMVMFMRALTLAYIFFAPAGNRLLFPLLGAAFGALATATYYFRNPAANKAPIEQKEAHVDLGPPADIATALKFGALLALIALGTHYARAAFGTGGMFGMAALSGFVDIDAVTIAMSKLGDNGQETADKIALAVIVAVLANGLAKTAYIIAIGRSALLNQGVTIFLAPIAFGAVGYGISTLVG